MEAPAAASYILAWLQDVDQSEAPDLAPITNTAPGRAAGLESTDDKPLSRLRGQPTPLLTVDSDISSSIEQVTLRRGAAFLPTLNMDYARRQFTTVITQPDLPPEDYSPSDYPSPENDVSPDDSESPGFDRTPSGGAALGCREITPEDFARDPSRTFAPRTESQNLARRERRIIQLQLEASGFSDPDSLHWFIRHAVDDPSPTSMRYRCTCPAGATVPINDRFHACDETAEPTATDTAASPMPGDASLAHSSRRSETSAGVSSCERFQTSEDGMDELVGYFGRPFFFGIEPMPMHPQSEMADFCRWALDALLSSIIVDTQAQAPPGPEEHDEEDGEEHEENCESSTAPASNYDPAPWLRGVSPSLPPLDEPAGCQPYPKPLC